jgi:hypothetical protein
VPQYLHNDDFDEALVRRVALGYAAAAENLGISFEELVAFGIPGVEKARARYRIVRAPYRSYAAWCIRQEITRGFAGGGAAASAMPSGSPDRPPGGGRGAYADEVSAAT